HPCLLLYQRLRAHAFYLQCHGPRPGSLDARYELPQLPLLTSHLPTLSSLSCFRSLHSIGGPPPIKQETQTAMAAPNALTGASVSRGGGASMSGSVTAVCPRSVVAAAPTSRTSSLRPMRCGVVGTAAPVVATAEGDDRRRFGQLAVPQGLVDELVEEALVWCSQHGLVVGDKNHPRSGKAPGVGLLHAPFALLPMSFPKVYWEQALELAPLFNELVHRVSLDGDFLQQTLARTKEVDPFTRRLLDIHSKMMELNKKEDIQLGLTRSDYMIDGATDKLLQVELNTISTSSNGLACGVSELHRNLIRHHQRELGLDPTSVVGNTAIAQHAEALATAWAEYNNQRRGSAGGCSSRRKVHV
uniref:Glutathione synthase substrate-binding domain-containing protein n=1 Tax=Aegilops tauschii subsp. strangulata TaxID=200361 RepID=A0A453ST39_AEGTS